MRKNEIVAKAQEAKAKADAVKATAETKEAQIKAYNDAMTELKTIVAKPVRHTMTADPTTQKCRLICICNGKRYAQDFDNISDARACFKQTVAKHRNLEQYVTRAGYVLITAEVEFKKKSAITPTQPKVEKLSQAAMF